MLFSMTFQAWKIVLPNLVTFHDWGHSVGKRYAVPTKLHLRLPNSSAGGRSGVADVKSRPWLPTGRPVPVLARRHQLSPWK